MARRRVIGPCRICGHVRELSFEHVPPRSAFNSRPVKVLEGLGIVAAGHDASQGAVQQKGAGHHTLCDHCNNVTGSWYGQAYVDWACHGLAYLPHARRAPSIALTYRVFPLRVLKQIVCMFFSANGPEFREKHPYLERFVMNRSLIGFPREIRIYCFLMTGAQSRQSGIAGSVRLESGEVTILSEIAFPPFGYVMLFSPRPPDPRLVDITFFASSSYAERRELHFSLPMLSVSTGYAGDYRSAAEVDRDARASGLPLPSSSR